MKAFVLLAGGLGVCVAGCIGPEPKGPQSSSPYETVYQRATNVFDSADFFKPAEAASSGLSGTLAPLVLQQAGNAVKAAEARAAFGSLTFSNGAIALEQSRPAIYWTADAVPINAKPHARLSYLWFYRGRQDEGSLVPQGIRATLNSAGRPAVWEVLTDRSGARLFFVSQSLEAAARKEFGKPLPGRHYATEPALEAAPDVVVARVIDDGPMAMGPIVYVGADARTVSTVICRCMTAQARKLVSTRTYDLLAWQSVPVAVLAQAEAAGHGRLAFWPGEPARAGYLESCLRLPRNF